jgi:hypothetical protein
MRKTICRGCFQTEVGYLPEVRISRVRKAGVRAKEVTFFKWSVCCSILQSQLENCSEQTKLNAFRVPSDNK